MKIYRSIEEVPKYISPPVVIAMGTFDGVHYGHQALFKLCIDRSLSIGAEPWALTFDPHPSLVLGPDLAPPLLSTTSRRLELIASTGISSTLLVRFDREFASKTCEEFVRDFLVPCRAKEIVIGYDFTFGKARTGNCETLIELGGHYGIKVNVVSPVSIEGGIVPSSTKVRQLLLEGRVRAAGALLGRDYQVSGEVVTGYGRGVKIGFPTANLLVDGPVLLPAKGVYAVDVHIEGERELGGEAEREGDAAEKVEVDADNGGRWPGAANIGTNPTFNFDNEVFFEIHLIGYKGPSLVGRRLRIEFRERLRAEKRFSSVEELAAQLADDVSLAERILSQEIGS